MSEPPSAEPLEPTIAYATGDEHASTSSSQTEVSRGKVGLVEGGRRRLSDETAALLRQRLKAVALILSITLAAVFLGTATARDVPLMVLRAAILAGMVGCYLVLRSRLAVTLAWLRVAELVVFGLVAVQIVVALSLQILAFAQQGDVASTIAGRDLAFLVWTALILLYGMFMLNTWRRAALILFPAACVPYLTTGVLQWHSPEVAEILDLDRFGMPMPVPILAAFAAVYASHALQSIRREAFQARQFGQYLLKQKLGSGGMGDVYEAEHVLLKRPCAIKLFHPGSGTDAALARFEREVRATAKLTHWNTVEIYDYGHSDDGTFYYVMELLPGLSLDELVKRHGPLPPERAVHLLRQTCHALREAHAAGLIHRDIKPANVFAANRGGVYDVAKVLDFGLVKQAANEQTPALHVTQVGSFSGSPLYMAPEQAAAFSDANPRTDIYSLGAVAYYLLTGRPPFSGRNPMEVIIAHSRDEVVPPSQLRQGVPADLEQVVLRCLAKAPADRFPDVECLEAALGACACAGLWDERQAAAWWQKVEAESADVVVVAADATRNTQAVGSAASPHPTLPFQPRAE